MRKRERIPDTKTGLGTSFIGQNQGLCNFFPPEVLSAVVNIHKGVMLSINHGSTVKNQLSQRWFLNLASSNRWP